jgi:hypothetical protein
MPFLLWPEAGPAAAARRGAAQEIRDCAVVRKDPHSQGVLTGVPEGPHSQGVLTGVPEGPHSQGVLTGVPEGPNNGGEVRQIVKVLDECSSGSTSMAEAPLMDDPVSNLLLTALGVGSA